MTQPLRVVLLEPDRYSPSARRLLESLGTLVEGPFDQDGLIEAAAAADVLVVRLGHVLDDRLFESAPRLRVIVSATTGLDHINTDAAKRHGVEVLSLQGETAFLRTVRATVEHTFALAMAVLRRIPAAATHVEDGGWSRDRFRGGELGGRRLGIVGYGRIGEAVGDLARAFHMDVAAFDPYRSGWGDSPQRARGLNELLGRSDMLSVHVPLNAETRGMIGEEELQTLPTGAILINTSRGEVVDEAALLAGLESGHLAGAGLDVLSDEPALARGEPHPVVAYARDHDTVVVTPHIGGATHESMERTEVFMAEKLIRWLGEIE